MLAKGTPPEAVNLRLPGAGQADIEIEQRRSGPSKRLRLQHIQAAPNGCHPFLPDQLRVGNYQQPPKVTAAWNTVLQRPSHSDLLEPRLGTVRGMIRSTELSTPSGNLRLGSAAAAYRSADFGSGSSH